MLVREAPGVVLAINGERDIVSSQCARRVARSSIAGFVDDASSSVQFIDLLGRLNTLRRRVTTTAA